MKITDHAYDRAKDRFRWKKKTIERMAKRALENGMSHKDTKGSLRKYFSGLWDKNKSANNIRIYGENVYLFSGVTLITLYRIPGSLIKNLKY